jgi:hypothetical protein
VAIELDSLASPSVVIGDTLRDSLGAVEVLVARALNTGNDVIPGAPIRFIALDTGIVEVDSITGAIVGVKEGQAQIIASIGGLQSDRVAVFVTLRPDTAFGADSTRQTMQLDLTGESAAQSAPLNVFVGHDTTTIAAVDTAVAVANYPVRYAIVFPADQTVSLTDTTRVLLANDQGRPSASALTSPTGIAGRRVRISTAVTQIPDSVVVEARVNAPDGTPLPGSPVRFVVIILTGS